MVGHACEFACRQAGRRLRLCIKVNLSGEFVRDAHVCSFLLYSKTNMAKIKIFIGVLVAMVILAGVLFYSVARESPTVQTGADTILFYGRECPHCRDVDKFLAENKIADKARYDSVEVWHNKDNANLMLQKAKECGIAEDKVGVPFVWSQGKCYVGTPDVEDLFKEKAGI